jgi:hypothetical protein
MFLIKIKTAALALFILGAPSTRAAWTATDDNPDTKAQPSGRNAGRASPAAKSNEEPAKRTAANPIAQLQRLQTLRMLVEPANPLAAANGVRGAKVVTAGGDGHGPFALLLMSAKLQDELKLSDAQRRRLRSISGARRDRMREVMQPDGDNGKAIKAVNLGGVFEQWERENDEILAEFLTRPQAKRLSQIVLQINGALALVDPDVAAQAGLLPEQLDAVQQIVADMKLEQQQQRMGLAPQLALAGGAARIRREPDAQKKGDGGGAALAYDAAAMQRNDAASGQRAASKRKASVSEKAAPAPPTPEESRARFGKLSESQEATREKAISRIAGALSASQKATFNRLLGKKVDVLGL